MKNINRNAVICIRTAPADHVDICNSIENQIDACLEYVNNNDFKVKKIITDINASNQTPSNKTSLQRLVDYLKLNKDVSLVIVNSFDRLPKSEGLYSWEGTSATPSEYIAFNPKNGIIKLVLMEPLEHYDVFIGQRVKRSMNDL